MVDPATRAGQPPDRIVVTRESKRLCESDQEEQFVEALIVLVTYERAVSRDGVIRMTDAQVKEFVADRFGGVPLHPEQIARLKNKYITRPTKAATRLELLRVLHTGEFGRRDQPGTPSEYRATGIELFLELGDEYVPNAATRSPSAA